VQVVSQIVCEKPKLFIQRLDRFVDDQNLALIRKFRNGFGDGVIETAVECSKFVDRDRRVQLERKVRGGLAEIAVIVNHLVDREPVLQQFAPVQRRRVPHFRLIGRPAARWPGDGFATPRVRGLLHPQRLDELIEEGRDSMLEAGFARARCGSLGDLIPASFD